MRAHVTIDRYADQPRQLRVVLRSKPAQALNRWLLL
jgi:hypothetical protein